MAILLKVTPEEAKVIADGMMNYVETDVKNGITQAWGALGLAEQWIGVDEYNFEQVLAAKVNSLYKGAVNIVKGACGLLEYTAKSATETANNNKLTGEGLDVAYATVEFQDWGYNNDEERTVEDIVTASETNKSTPNQKVDQELEDQIRQALDTFVGAINTVVDNFKTATTEQLAECLTGGWNENLDAYLVNVQTQLGTVLTSYNDIMKAASGEDGLVHTITEAGQTVATEAQKASEELTQATAGISKWGEE